MDKLYNICYNISINLLLEDVGMNDKEYTLIDFVKDLLDTEDVVSLLESCNKSWKEIAGEFIKRNPGMLITEEEYQKEILSPYLCELDELLSNYNVEGFQVRFVEALRERDTEVLMWCFEEVDFDLVLYVYFVNGKWVFSKDHPVLIGDLDPSLMCPTKHWKVYRKV